MAKQLIIFLTAVLCLLIGVCVVLPNFVEIAPLRAASIISGDAPTLEPIQKAPTPTASVPVPSPTPSAAALPTVDPSTSAVPSDERSPEMDYDTNTVYVTDTGENYHREDCQYLFQSKIPITLDAAKDVYSPCSVCEPPI